MKNYYGRKIVVKLYINIFQLLKFHKTKEIQLYTGLEKHRDPQTHRLPPLNTHTDYYIQHTHACYAMLSHFSRVQLCATP